MLGWCAVTLVSAGCSYQVDGLPAMPIGEGLLSPPLVNADELLLDLERMRGITGAGEDLTIIPSMDDHYPVDIDLLAKDVPAPCRFLFAETATFGTAFDDFHKTTYQDPPERALISQAAAAYPDVQTARRTFDDLVGTTTECSQTGFGQVYVGDVTTDTESLHTRPGSQCGRDYQLKSAVLVEVTFCAFPESVAQMVLTNIVNKAPG
jgi:PknH-like extracellular domain